MVFKEGGVCIESIFADIVFVITADVIRIAFELANHNDFVNMGGSIFLYTILFSRQLLFMVVLQAGRFLVRELISRALC